MLLDELRAAKYLGGLLDSVLRTLVGGSTVKVDDRSLVLTERGWDQARAMGLTGATYHVLQDAADEHLEFAPIDVRDAAPTIQFTRPDGTVVVGRLAADADRWQWVPFRPPASDLVDALYPRAEVDGRLAAGAFYTVIKELGIACTALEILTSKAHVRLVGHQREVRSGSAGGRRARVGRAGAEDAGRQGARPRWERVLCEALADLGGHADWHQLALSIQSRPDVESVAAWREECMQALRRHTAPSGHCYFEASQTERVLILTEAGRKLAARRAIDDRAPTLSKLVAKVLQPNGDGKLTPHELYALLQLSVVLGKPSDAEAIYRLLPESFPDEEQYHLLPMVIARAAEFGE